MFMEIFRITNKKYADDLTGKGAALNGGRWNKVGTPVLYCGASVEIALLETIVHLPANFAPNLILLTLQIPNDSIDAITVSELPKKWYKHPAPEVLAEIGDAWTKSNSSIALKVPSVIVHTAHNFVLNCSHPKYQKVKVLKKQPFPLDGRLTKN